MPEQPSEEPLNVPEAKAEENTADQETPETVSAAEAEKDDQEKAEDADPAEAAEEPKPEKKKAQIKEVELKSDDSTVNFGSKTFEQIGIEALINDTTVRDAFK